jgi:hypothetical protein
MKNYFLIATTLLLVFVFSSACGDSNSPTSVSGPTTPVPDSTVGVIADPSFSNDIQPIFNQNGCANGGCHGVAMAANLDLQPGASHANLVNVTATREPLLRVIPGNADGSYLVVKLEGRQSVGSQMPLGGQPLSETDLTNIKNWINRGAQNN